MIKRKIVYEIQSGFHSHRTAATLYGISRNTVNAWVIKYSLLTFNHIDSETVSMRSSTESSTTHTLSRQVYELKKALEKALLKIDSLETLIKVSEEELKIKIRKKFGPKQSKE
ncbi:hypothetical protein [Elizabethkingia anophelis]|uniref:hypothetical protein n=1 Tax=Elizabethkingia anophelis TaxID=1117645 RepID=UPI003786FA04